MDANLIAKRLTELRGTTSREEVAKRCGITISALSNYENGIRIPRDEVKIRLAEFYHKSVQSIFFEEKVHEM